MPCSSFAGSLSVQKGPAVTVPVLKGATGDVGIGPLHLCHDSMDGSGFVPVVAVEHTDYFAAGQGDALVESIADATIRLADPEGDIVFAGAQYIDGTILGTAVDDDVLESWKVLRQYAVDCAGNRSGTVPDYRDYADLRTSGGRLICGQCTLSAHQSTFARAGGIVVV
jgi:hypothetical protein